MDNSVNLLLIGLDSRKDMNGNNLPNWVVQDELHAGGSSDVGGYNTNSLILLHIPAGGGKVQAFSIPRDDYVQTLNGDGSSQGMHKIKEAYGLAKSVAETKLQAQGIKGAALEQQSREVGREATITTLQSFLGVRIDHFAEVNLMGFYDIAQAVQPITVCLNHATSDPAISGQGSGANFHKGLNTLNFAQQAPNLTGGKVVFNTLPITGFAHMNGEDVNTVSPSQIKRIMQQLIGHDPAPAASATGGSAPAPVKAAPATVDVMNGSGITGAAATESKDLVAQGYTAGLVSSHSARSHTSVLYGTGADTAAQQITTHLGLGAATASSAVKAGHVEIILGAGFTPPAATGSSSGSGSGGSSSTIAPVAVPMQGAAVQAGGIPCVD